MDAVLTFGLPARYKAADSTDLSDMDETLQ